MSLSFETVLRVIVLPAVIAMVAGWLEGLYRRRSPTGQPDSNAAMSEESVQRGGAITAIGWVMAMVAVHLAANWTNDTESFWQRLAGNESWQRAWLPMLGLALVLPLGRTRWKRQFEARWVLAAVLTVSGAAITFPAGEGWTDLYEIHRIWLPLVVVSSLANTWALESLARSGAAAWCLLVLCGPLGGATLLTALNYAAPAEWCLAAISATAAVLMVGAIRGFWRQSFGGLWAVIYPGCLMPAAMVATARFYTYETYPWWVYAATLFLPVIVVLVDIPLRQHSWKLRVPVAATVTIGLLAACAASLLTGSV